MKIPLNAGTTEITLSSGWLKCCQDSRSKGMELHWVSSNISPQHCIYSYATETKYIDPWAGQKWIKENQYFQIAFVDLKQLLCVALTFISDPM